MYIQKRNIVTCILLTIFTCGIYHLLWLYAICGDMAIINRSNEHEGFKLFVLSFITCGIYYFYWIYKTSRQIYEAETDLGMFASDNTFINLLLAIFQFSIVSTAIIQNGINDIADEYSTRR